MTHSTSQCHFGGRRKDQRILLPICEFLPYGIWYCRGGFEVLHSREYRPFMVREPRFGYTRMCPDHVVSVQDECLFANSNERLADAPFDFQRAVSEGRTKDLVAMTSILGDWLSRCVDAQPELPDGVTADELFSPYWRRQEWWQAAA
jgi:hypothetical protein